MHCFKIAIDFKRYTYFGDFMKAEREVDYYSKPDPARIKLIRNVKRFHRSRKQTFYYKKAIPTLPKQTKGKYLKTFSCNCKKKTKKENNSTHFMFNLLYLLL